MSAFRSTSIGVALYAEAMGVKSSNILQVRVTTKPAAIQIGPYSLSLTELAIIALIIALIVVLAIALARARRTRVLPA